MTTAPEYLKMLAEARQNKDEKKIRDISMEITELDTSYPENLSAQFRLASVVLNDDGDAVLALKILEKIVKSGVDSPDVE